MALRGENVASGTSTTGTGTLTMASPPTLPGSIDHHEWLTSKGYVSGGVHLIPYKIVEYVGTPLQSAQKQMEQGWGTYTLGSSLTADTLARTTVLSTQVVGTDTYSDAAPSPISIGTAANVLVFLGAGALDVMQCNPYFETSAGDALGFLPDGAIGQSQTINFPASGYEIFVPFRLHRPLLLKRGSIYVNAATGGGTSTAYFRLYEMSSAGRPGRLILDLGALGGANPLNATGFISTAAASPGEELAPSEFFASIYVTWSTGTPAYKALNFPNGYEGAGLLGSSGSNPQYAGTATGTSNPAPDPANLTNYPNFTSLIPPLIWLNNQ